MPFCSSCGNQIDSSHRFCGRCGNFLAALENSAPTSSTGISSTGVNEAVQTLPYIISPARIVLFSILTYGTYMFYWFYITWKHYRDHTGNEAYPIWHMLVLLVPIYGYFRAYAHARAFRDMMQRANVPSSISPGWVVILLVISSILGGIAFQFSFTDITQNIALGIFVIDLISMALVATLLLHVQGNLNTYWQSLKSYRMTYLNLGIGEMVLGGLGVLAWIDTIALLVSSDYRAM